MHVLKYRCGEKVRIVADEYADSTSHEMEMGSVHTIVESVLESREGREARNYQEYRLDSDAWVTETEIEPA